MRTTLCLTTLMLLTAGALLPGHAKALRPGKTPGTYAFSTAGQVLWFRPPPGQVQVSICDFTGNALHRSPIGKDGTFEITADLPPGSYYLQAKVDPLYEDLYWPARGSTLNIAKNGNAALGHSELYLVEKMEPLGPHQDAIVSDPHPVLRWKDLPHAREYLLQVSTWDPEIRNWVALQQPVRTSLSYYQLPQPLKPNTVVLWQVHALNQLGDRYAGWKNARFFSPGGAEMVERDLAMGESVTALQQPDATGKPWLGVSISSTEPSKSRSPSGFSPPSDEAGIYVHAVGNHSPAILAGVQPGDVIMTYEGIRVRYVKDLLQLVAHSSIGGKVKLGINRGGRMQTITVKVGPRP